MAHVAILLMAAGASRRMRGEDKLLLDIDGEPLLRRVARRAVATGFSVFVTLAPDRPARQAALQGLDVSVVPVEDASDGMSASLRKGLAALPPDTSGAIVLMADMPDLRTEDLNALARRFLDLGGDTVCRAAAEDGTLGSPALVPRRLFAAMSRLIGDSGGRQALQAERQELVVLPGRRALTDLDTPEDWAAWRAANG